MYTCVVAVDYREINFLTLAYFLTIIIWGVAFLTSGQLRQWHLNPIE